MQIDPDSDRVNDIGIVTDSVEDPVEIISRRFTAPDFDKPDDTTRTIRLSLVPDTDDLPAYVFSRHIEFGDDDRIVARLNFRNSRFAVGTYLMTVEQHRSSPLDALADLRDQAPSLTNSYDSWRDGLTEPDRQALLFGQTNERLDYYEDIGDPRLSQWHIALREGEWRSTDLTNAGRTLARTAIDNIDAHDPRSCYYTVLGAYRELWHDDSVQYCEGIVLPDHAGNAFEHAWLEIDGEVAEVTWPAHGLAAGDAVYYGTTVPRATVKRRLQNRPPTTTMLLDADAYAERVRRQAAQAYAAGLDPSRYLSAPSNSAGSNPIFER